MFSGRIRSIQIDQLPDSGVGNCDLFTPNVDAPARSVTSHGSSVELTTLVRATFRALRHRAISGQTVDALCQPLGIPATCSNLVQKLLQGSRMRDKPWTSPGCQAAARGLATSYEGRATLSNASHAQTQVGFRTGERNAEEPVVTECHSGYD